MMLPNPPLSVFDLDAVDLQGNPLPLVAFKKRVLLIVNTASLCGFSYQFKGLENLWQRYRDRGLTVLGVPSNDFGRQEPGHGAAIASLCLQKFGITFPLLQKTPVKGEAAHPLFQWLAQEGGFLARPRWNFYKYLVGRDGHLKNWYLPVTPPEAPRFEQALAKLLDN